MIPRSSESASLRSLSRRRNVRAFDVNAPVRLLPAERERTSISAPTTRTCSTLTRESCLEFSIGSEGARAARETYGPVATLQSIRLCVDARVAALRARDAERACADSFDLNVSDPRLRQGPRPPDGRRRARPGRCHTVPLVSVRGDGGGLGRVYRAVKRTARSDGFRGHHGGRRPRLSAHRCGAAGDSLITDRSAARGPGSAGWLHARVAITTYSPGGQAEPR